MFLIGTLLATIFTLAGVVQALAGWRSVCRFVAEPPPLGTGELPPLTLLKPLHGDEPLLEAALESVVTQNYPQFQVVFGVQNAADPAVAIVRRLQARYPDRAIDLVIDPRQHGANKKVGNLINMLPLARYDHLLIADSDLHCAPDYLRKVAAEFAVDGVGLVTTLYAGLAAQTTLAARLGATAINHSFLPGALMSRDLGRQDCLGATMALRRDMLRRIGGLEELVEHLADDNRLGQLVRDAGLRIRIAATVPATTVPETTLDQLFRHELRWSRTILSLVPFEFAASTLQYPIFWALLAWALSLPVLPPTCGAAVVALAWVARSLAASGIDSALGLVAQSRATAAPILLLPLRDLLSIAIVLASYWSDRVEWRGQIMHTSPETPLHDAPPKTDAYPRPKGP